MSAGCTLPDFVRTSIEPLAVCLKPATASLSARRTPCFSRWRSTRRAHSGSSGSHDLIEHLDQRHFESAMDQVFRHLEADVSAADHHRTLCRPPTESRGRVLPG